ncbi:hypothetical protein QM716_15885 [Rhodococcus sp. IEGM 1409]|uniref:hypothetical protein n=1 Tax=Rhodococcus sp. IEGM 1409 TaxID=3047082 RepID=UPI0024B7E6CF|nr:hypothetical protein [Rhodococcus sp. IEGM 1409]MDI9901339.1 hypothetical protein [Rhodococcus sp. IEGM 1409]
MSSPAAMPGASAAKRRRRVLVEYERIAGERPCAVIGRPLVDSDTSSVYTRHGFLELRGEWPRTDDIAIAHRRVITVTFIDVNAEIPALLRDHGLAPSEEPPY